MVSVRKSGKHVTNSPFKILVGPSEIGDASKVRVWGKGLSEGQTFQVAEFIVDTRNAGTFHPRSPPHSSWHPTNSCPSFLPKTPPPLSTASSPGLLGPVGIQPRAHWGKLSPASSVTVKRKLSCRELIGPPTPWNLTGLQYRIFQKASTVDLDDKPSACLATSHGAILLSGHCTHSASV